MEKEKEDTEKNGDKSVLSALPIEWVVLTTVAVHLVLCPYTKVEESFNMQAVHDILYHSTDISQYDHLEFPGVVPRTFLGPLVLAAFSAPLAAASPLVASKFAVQFVVRMVLGSLSVCAFYRFRQSVESVFGRQVATWLVCVTVTQFHFMFYLTRTLPNMMAMPLVLLAFSFWMRQQHGPFIWCSAAAILIFRSELAALLGILLLMELCSRRLGILRCLKFCVPAGVCVLLLSVGVDSLFWRRLVWPEGEVLWFNVVLNKSAEWGTSPALWYWYSALPRALAASMPLVPAGLLADARCRPLAAPALAFVALYSLLPHKELRFIIYVVPLLNVAAARACHGIWEGRLKSTWRAYLATAMCCHLLVNCALTVLLAAVARHNYPGGAALARLHYLEPEPAYVHLDVYAAQTGVTRFLQHRHDWRYNKTENLTPGSPKMHSFTHLLIEAKSKRSSSLKPYLDTHMILGSVDVFSHIQFNYGVFPPLRLRTRPAIFILYNKNQENVQWAPDEGDAYEEGKATEPPAASEDYLTPTEEIIDDEPREEEGRDSTRKQFVFPEHDDRFGGETRVQGNSRAEKEDDRKDSYLPPGVLR